MFLSSAKGVIVPSGLMPRYVNKRIEAYGLHFAFRWRHESFRLSRRAKVRQLSSSGEAGRLRVALSSNHRYVTCCVQYVRREAFFVNAMLPSAN